MSTKSSEECIDQLIRQIRRIDLFLLLIWVVPGVFILASILAAWIFGSKPLWVQILDWSGHALLLLSIVLLMLVNTGRPRFIRRLVFGPERELSEQEKADRAQRDEIQKQFDRLTRPISWTYSIAACGAAANILLWLTGQLQMTLELGIATASLAVIAGLSLWGMRRIHTAYYHQE